MADAALAKIKAICLRHHIRLDDVCKDFDPLRCGSVYTNQFLRALRQSRIYPEVSVADMEAVATKYPGKFSNSVDYASFFADVHDVFIDRQFTRDLSVPPPAARNLDSSLRASLLHNADSGKAAELEHAMALIKTTATARGVDVAFAFKPWDVHNRGRVSEDRFRRGFCFPELLSPAQLDAIIEHYRCSDGLIAYRAWALDCMGTDVSLNKYQEPGVAPTKESNLQLPKLPVNGARPSASAAEVPAADRVTFEEVDMASWLVAVIRQRVQSLQISVTETFRDVDPLRSGHMLPCRFTACLLQLRLPELNFSQEMLDALVDAYAIMLPGGEKAVAWTRFVADVDLPVQRSIQMGSGLPQKEGPNPEFRGNKELEVLVKALRDLMKARRVELTPIFEDMDRALTGLTLTRRITRTRFERALTYCGIHLEPHQYRLLCDAYAADVPDRVNYQRFLWDIDDTFLDQRPSHRKALAEAAKNAPAVVAAPTNTTFLRKGRLVGQQDNSPDAVLLRLRLEINSKRIRLGEFLRDADPLRSGLIPMSRLERGINNANIILDADELDGLRQRYESCNRPGFIEWRRLVNDVDEATVTAHLERDVNADPEAVAREVTAQRLKESAVKISADTQLIIDKIKTRLKDHPVVLRNVLASYDRHNVGFLSPDQFYRAVTAASVRLSPEEVAKIVADFTDLRSHTVYYRRFAEAVERDSSPAADAGKQSTSFTSSSPLAQSTLSKSKEDLSVEGVIESIQRQMLRLSIRVFDFLSGGDKLRKGTIPKSRFVKGLSSAGLVLSPAQVDVLAAHFTDPASPSGEVLWRKFTDLVERVYTIPGLEKDPGADPTPVRPSKAPPAGGFLEGEDYSKLMVALQSCARQVRTRGIELVQFFRDFDKLNRLLITKTQFGAALASANISLRPGSVLERSDQDLLAAHFSNERGDVEYESFLAAIRNIHA